MSVSMAQKLRIFIFGGPQRIKYSETIEILMCAYTKFVRVIGIRVYEPLEIMQ